MNSILSFETCIAEAAEMDRMAGISVAHEARYLVLAESWRRLAKQAAWQDSFEPEI